jgi:branched-chain amino acid transport system permease protein
MGPRARLASLAALLLAAALVPVLVSDNYLLHLCILVFSTVVMGESWNVLGGFGGQYSVGHAAYFGLGAYTSLILLHDKGIPPWFGVWLGMAVAVAVALAIGSITFRLRGPYFVLASIAVAEIFRLAALNWKALTNGAEGILAGDTPIIHLGPIHVVFTGKLPYYYMGLFLAVASIAVNQWVRASRLGYYLQAIREDQDAAHSLGIPLTATKNAGLAISAAFTALAGGFYANYTGFIDPAGVFGIDISIQIVLVCIVGGIGTVAGPALGAVLLVLLGEALRTRLANAHVLVYGILLIVTVLFMPDGVLGFFRGRFARRAAPS